MNGAGTGSVTVRLFALLREAAGTDLVEIPLGDDRSVRGVARELAGRFPSLAGIFGQRRILVVVNQRYAGMETGLEGGEEVAFLPPVSGG